MHNQYFKSFILASVAVGALAWPSLATAQNQPAPVPPPSSSDVQDTEILVTGSRIKRDPNNSSLPLQIITPDDLTRDGTSSPEQMLANLSTTGNGPENLASNADVVSGAQRGTNGLSSANLRGQGAGATLVLLNGRRVAAHGLSGSAVDVNQIPLAVIERVEVLKDGASAIYGTDAIGGVINFITKTDYEGVGVQGFVDIPLEGNGEIYRLSGTAGYGDLQEQGFNIMGAVAYRWNKVLFGTDRDWSNSNQPERGLSIDTRGTPQATVFNIGINAAQNPRGTLIGPATGFPTFALTGPNGANLVGGGINPLDLPGGAGCESMPDGLAYDHLLWNTPSAFYACSWDTSRNVVLQQPIKTFTYYSRGTVNLGGDHQAYVEVTGSRANSAKRFSHPQFSANTTNLPLAYPRNALTAVTYDSIVNSIRSIITDPTQLAQFNARAAAQLPIAYRWRCLQCGPREYTTNSKTFRAALGVEGPLFEGWDYRAGASYARSETSSELGSGYYYRGTLANGAWDTTAPVVPGAPGMYGMVGVLNSGLINPFSLAQTPEGLAALRAVSAEGAVLYGGRYQVKQFDVSFSGPLFALPGGDVKIAIGADYRQETYEFNGSDAAAATAPVIFLAAFDNVNALTPKKRNVKAAYAEVLIPVFDMLEINAAARIDDYTGFGSTFNPKVSVKFRPIEWLMFRGSYSTGFRVPSFNQIFNGVTDSVTNTGANIADPATCPSPTAPNPAIPGCALITPNVLTGGNLNLGPETAKMASVGVVFTPTRYFSISADWWMVNVDDTIQTLTFRQLLENYDLFPDRFIRDPVTNEIDFVDARVINAGARRTQALEFSMRANADDIVGGTVSVGLDGTYLLKKREKLTPTAPYGPSLIGVFSFSGDLGIRWKHSAYISWRNDDWSISLSQLFRQHYKNGALPGILAGTVSRPGYNPIVDDYVVYNMSVSFIGAENYKFTFGVRNLFDTDPPFAITYDGVSGAGGSWEPRVADPRGRSFTIGVEAKF